MFSSVLIRLNLALLLPIIIRKFTVSSLEGIGNVLPHSLTTLDAIYRSVLSVYI